jgi:hypothetical protein
MGGTSGLGGSGRCCSRSIALMSPGKHAYIDHVRKLGRSMLDVRCSMLSSEFAPTGKMPIGPTASRQRVRPVADKMGLSDFAFGK